MPLPVALASMTDLVIVLAFNNPESTGPGISSAMPPPPDDPGSSSSTTPNLVHALFLDRQRVFDPDQPNTLRSAPFSQAAAFIAANGGGQRPEAMTRQRWLRHLDRRVSPPSLRPYQRPAHSPAEMNSTKPLLDVAPLNPAGVDPAGGLAASGIQNLVARVQVIVQAVVRGFSRLGGQVRTIIESIFTTLVRTQAALEVV